MARKFKDAYANRYRGRFTTSANCEDWSGESFNTGMNVAQMPAMKWDILWVDISPSFAGIKLGYPGGAADLGISFQLCIGTQTDMLYEDDMQVIAHCSLVSDAATSGVGHQEFPLSMGIHSPIPVIASVLTIGCEGKNVANINAMDIYYEIGYVIRSTTPTEVAETLAALGAL